MKKSFSTRKNILFLYFLLSLCISFSTVQGYPACKAVRRTRTRRKCQRGGVFALAAADSPRARARRRRRCCCPPTPPSHRIGIGKKRGVSNLGIDKNPIGIKPLYEPQPFEPAIPFFSTNWSAVSHPSQRVIPLRHVSVTKCPLFC